MAGIVARLDARYSPADAQSEFAVLTALQDFGNLAPSDLSGHLATSEAGLGRVLTKLQWSGLVDRRIEAGGRGRQVLVLTTPGRHRLTELEALARAIQVDLLRSLDAVERVQLHSILGKVLAGR